MYYVGYQLGYGVTYYQFQGLAISTDGGESFERAPPRAGPRSQRGRAAEPHLGLRPPPRRRLSDVVWSGGDRWTVVDGKPLPVYNMRFLESPDGVEWPDEGAVCLDFDLEDEHAFGRPWVWEEGDGLAMMYSVRTRSKDYRLGLARLCRRAPLGSGHDDEVGIDVSPAGWDSEMIAYGSVFRAGRPDRPLLQRQRPRQDRLWLRGASRAEAAVGSGHQAGTATGAADPFAAVESRAAKRRRSGRSTKWKLAAARATESASLIPPAQNMLRWVPRLGVHRDEDREMPEVERVGDAPEPDDRGQPQDPRPLARADDDSADQDRRGERGHRPEDRDRHRRREDDRQRHREEDQRGEREPPQPAPSSPASLSARHE